MLDAVVIGGGPAGLAVSRELKIKGIEHVVLERGDRIGASWVNAYESLVLHTGKHLSTLPGMPFPRGTPLFPTRADFIAYLERYAAVNALPVRLGWNVLHTSPSAVGWRIDTSHEPLEARALIVATGIMSGPVIPEFPGMHSYRGRLLHSVEYRAPQPYADLRVLVVGVGNSGGEIASELADAGVQVSVSVRSGANVVPLSIAGVPIQYLSYLLRKLPRSAQERVVAAVARLVEKKRGPPVLPRPAHSPLDAIPLIGFHLVDAIRAGKIHLHSALRGFTEDGVLFADGTSGAFDAVILATGFRSALAPLAELVRTDARGFALRTDRITSADRPALFFVGHNYDATGGLRNIAQDAVLAGRAVAALVKRSPRGEPSLR